MTILKNSKLGFQGDKHLNLKVGRKTKDWSCKESIKGFIKLNLIQLSKELMKIARIFSIKLPQNSMEH
jgi:hypothetical protein